MKYAKISKIKAIVLTIILIGTFLIIPVNSIGINRENVFLLEEPRINEKNKGGLEFEPILLDTYYDSKYPDSSPLNLEDFDDAGHRKDAGDKINRATYLFPGEMVDNTPGRGRTGKLSSVDDEDWYFFSICEGQTFTVVMDPQSGYDFDAIICDENGDVKAESRKSGAGVREQLSYTPEASGYTYILYEFISGPDEGQYSFDITINNQNDAGTGNDAGNSYQTATSLTTGEYYGYLDMNDEEDWYNFQANAGQGIHFNLEMKKTSYLSDFDISLYNPSGEYVHEEDFYYNDELLYPSDETGIWTVKIDIFPGYANAPQPTEWDYFTYGSGAYRLDFNLESSAPAPPAPIPQPQITPIAKSFNIQNDPNSNRDEYCYLASIPACNFLNEGKRYLAPIFYEGDYTLTDWYETGEDVGTVQDTVQYLRDDWETYLSSHGKTALEYNIPSDPIEAASEIATQNWESSDLAVIAVDGSSFEDDVKKVLEESNTLSREFDEITVDSDDPMFQTDFGYTTFLSDKWCAVMVGVYGVRAQYRTTAGAILDHIFPPYNNVGSDDWPVPYDIPGDATDIYFPVTTPGIWSANSKWSPGSWDSLKFTKIAGDRYKIKVDNPDSVLSVRLETDELSDLFVYLVDPDGNIRAPDIPHWNGPINPIHVWNGFETMGFVEWSLWSPDPHEDFSTEVLHPETGTWTAIVVPRYTNGPDYTYTLTAHIRTINKNRADAAVSAANAAIIASQENIPLLYVKMDNIPTETTTALNSLGVSKIIFVERNNIGENVRSSLPNLEADLTTMQEIIDYIKNYEHSENYITITSIKSGDGYFAPAAMIAAYHCSPLLRIGDAPGNPAGVADRIETWRLWAGDYYHGARAPGALLDATEPLPGKGKWTINTLIQAALYFLTDGNSGSVPEIGMDAKRYWNEELHDSINNWIKSYGLELDGQEAYCFVGPRKDLYYKAHSTMMGNNSYAGHIPGTTPAYTSAIINRNVLYPALIYANPNRDVTLAHLLNFAEGADWKTNDGTQHYVYVSGNIKKIFGTHFRNFQSHILWDAHLEAINNGASIFYYAGHGTGGSGMGCLYQTYEHGNFPDYEWWDSWRAYMYDDWKTPRDNGRRWPNPHHDNIYDIVHYNYIDGLFENLRSNAVFYMSCSTGDSYGPMVYLDHGAVLWYGNAGSGITPEAELLDIGFFEDALINGEPIAQAYSHQVWLHFRDFTTRDPTAMYGISTLYPGHSITSVPVIYGDPNLYIYSPEWSSPTPIDA